MLAKCFPDARFRTRYATHSRAAEPSHHRVGGSHKATRGMRQLRTSSK